MHQCGSAHFAQADPEFVAIEVGVLPALSIGGRRATIRPTSRGSVLLVTQVLVLQNVIGVLSLKVTGNRGHVYHPTERNIKVKHHGEVGNKTRVPTGTSTAPYRDVWYGSLGMESVSQYGGPTPPY